MYKGDYNSRGLKKKLLHWNNSKYPRFVLNKSLKQNPSKENLYGFLSLISPTIQVGQM